MHGSGGLDELLKKDNVTIEELLDEENLVVELKNASSKIHVFLTPRQIRKLIEFVIVEPTDPNDKKRSYKYPYVSCEILSSDSFTILNAFFPPPKKENVKSSSTSPFDDDEKRDSLEKTSEGESSEDGQEKKSGSEGDEDKQSGAEVEGSSSKDEPADENLLRVLCSLLSDKTVNLTLAGYFGKILTNLLAKKGDLTLDFIFGDDGQFLQNLSRHIYSRSIAELVLKILTAEISNPVYIEQKYEVVRRLITCQFNSESDFEALANIAYLLGEVISKNPEFGTFITRNRELLDILFTGLIGTNSSLLQQSSNIVISLLTFWKSHKSNKVDGEPAETEEGKDEANPNLSTFDAVLFEFIPKICAFFSAGSAELSTPVPTSHGSFLKKLGSDRLKLIEVIKYVVLLDDELLHKQLASCHFFTLCLSFVESNEWNNILHAHVEQILKCIFDGSSLILRDSLFNDAAFLDFIINCCEKPDYNFGNSTARRVRKGYMGHLIKVSNLINRLVEKDEFIRDAVSMNKNWSTFCEVVLEATNQKDNYDLGGARKLSMEDNEMVQRFDDDHERVSSTFSSLSLPTDTFGSLFPPVRGEVVEGEEAGNEDKEEKDEEDDEKENKANEKRGEESEKKVGADLSDLDRFLQEKRHQIRFPLSNSPPRQIQIEEIQKTAKEALQESEAEVAANLEDNAEGDAESPEADASDPENGEEEVPQVCKEDTFSESSHFADHLFWRMQPELVLEQYE